MTTIEQALGDYLALRRGLGYKLVRSEKLLRQYLAYLDDAGLQLPTLSTAVASATLPAGGGSWRSYRLTAVRGFAAYLHLIDPAIETVPPGLLPDRPHRATPYLYPDGEITALMRAAAALRSPLRAASYETLIGLLSVTGMRVGEAIRLDRTDFDSADGLIVVRDTKFGKTRALPLDRSTVDALERYLRVRDRLDPAATRSPALLVSAAGTRLLYGNVQSAFHRFVADLALQPRSARCRPRLHDLRHTFAVNSMLDAYRSSADVQARLPLVSTYLGHVDPANTYWYLSDSPELMSLAAERLEQSLERSP